MVGPHDKPAAEVEVDEALVRHLLRHQHPDLADRPLVLLGAGWDNALWRVGDDLIARLPRRELAAHLVAHEQQWLPVLAPHLPLPVPVPVRIGSPDDRYRWSWSIVPYLPGVRAMDAAPRDPDEAATAVGRFIAALHRPAPADAPPNPYRGVPLADRDDRTLGWVDQLAELIDAPAVRRCWIAHRDLPGWSGPPVWLHGDLHPNNLLVDEGRISAVVDFGDLTAGDPATDLAVAWTLLPAPARSTLRQAVGTVDDVTWHRARGWALSLALAYLAHSADDPSFARLGRRAIAAVLEDPDQP